MATKAAISSVRVINNAKALRPTDANACSEVFIPTAATATKRQLREAMLTLSVIIGGKSQAPEVSLNDGYMAVIMGMAAQISMKEHRAVEISELTRAMNG